MDKSTTAQCPLWEDMPPQNVPEFFGVIASEVWYRTREPECEAKIAEATLAAMRDKGSWSSVDHLVSEAYYQAMTRGEQGALVGFYVTAIIQARKHNGKEELTTEEITTRAMQEGGLRPMTPEERATFKARYDAAGEASRLLRANQLEVTKEASK